MAVTCAFCGVSMPVAEVTQRPYDGVAGNYHQDCAYMAYLENSGPVTVDPVRKLEVSSTFGEFLQLMRARQAAAPAAPVAAAATGSGLGIGAYQYAVTFVDNVGGESAPGTAASVTTTSGSQQVNLSAIPTGPAVTSKRKIYRTAVGGSQLKYLTTLADNTTTTYTDTTPDSSLGANAPTSNNFGLAGI
jgi:hypothetical protein